MLQAFVFNLVLDESCQHICQHHLAIGYRCSVARFTKSMLLEILSFYEFEELSHIWNQQTQQCKYQNYLNNLGRN